MPPCLANFDVPVEMRFCDVGQAGLQLLASSDPLDSASQSAGITGISHETQPLILNSFRKYIMYFASFIDNFLAH